MVRTLKNVPKIFRFVVNRHIMFELLFHYGARNNFTKLFNIRRHYL